MHAGHAHAALVFDGEDCVGWCQYGPPVELPRIKNQRAYLAAGPAGADWRITCFFSAKGYRGKGVADRALAGAVNQIAEAGGGYVEGFPEDTEGRTATGAFLFNGTVSSFLRQGFERKHQIGKHKWLVARPDRPA
ncbi:MAG: hypothetical protein R3D84_13330 [Paracoccaceae bacterium]